MVWRSEELMCIILKAIYMNCSFHMTDDFINGCPLPSFCIINSDIKTFTNNNDVDMMRPNLGLYFLIYLFSYLVFKKRIRGWHSKLGIKSWQLGTNHKYYAIVTQIASHLSQCWNYAIMYKNHVCNHTCSYTCNYVYYI